MQPPIDGDDYSILLALFRGRSMDAIPYSQHHSDLALGEDRASLHVYAPYLAFHCYPGEPFCHAM